MNRGKGVAAGCRVCALTGSPRRRCAAYSSPASETCSLCFCGCLIRMAVCKVSFGQVLSRLRYARASFVDSPDVRAAYGCMLLPVCFRPLAGGIRLRMSSTFLCCYGTNWPPDGVFIHSPAGFCSKILSRRQKAGTAGRKYAACCLLFLISFCYTRRCCRQALYNKKYG